MPRYAAFLRAINVGGRRVAKVDLCAPFEGLGLEAVTSFRASGNVIFDCPRKPSAKSIEAALEKALGYDVAVFLRRKAELEAIAKAAPDGAHILFLTAKPSQALKKKVGAVDTGRDRLEFGERELFWLPANGVSDSDLDMKTFEKVVGVYTMRTKGTVEQIAAKYFAD